MYVLEVLPLAAGVPGGTLSYRSAEDAPFGSIVTVTLRRRRVRAVVVGSQSALEAKAALKTASYTLSGNVSESAGRLPKPFMEAVVRIAAWHAAPTGSILASLLQEEVVADRELLLGYPESRGTEFSVESIELPLRARADSYRAIAIARAGRGMATLLVVPTLAEVEYWKRELAGLKPVVLSGSLTGARRRAALEKAHGAVSLIIATPLFSFIPLKHLGHICIERAGAGGYKLPKRPYLDMRVGLLELARAYGLPISYGDFPLPLELRADTRALPAPGTAITVIDTRKETAGTDENAPWSAVPEKLRVHLAHVLSAGGRAAVLAVRKSYAPVVVCRDCGQALKDERGAVYAFTQEGGERRFRTSDGVSVLSTKTTCPTCGSWNLLPLGVGVERVVEELQKLFPESGIVHFDADAVRTAVGAKKKLTPLSEPGTIVVGTEAMMPWLLAAAPEPIDLAAIASADSLLALPFWRARERFVRLAYLLGAVAPEVVVGTRLPDDASLSLLRDPADPAFFAEETALRAALGYPPFGTLISFSFVGSAHVLDQLEAEVRRAVAGIPTSAAGWTRQDDPRTESIPKLRKISDRPVRGTTSQRTLVLMLPKDHWPDNELATRISSLSPAVRVSIDPESFW